MIKSLHVKKFRAMQELTVPLGRKITVIAGQNATCKSTLLGMIGQPFGLKEKTIFGKEFSTKFSNIFKFSPDKDKPGEHEYEIEFFDDTIFGKTTEIVKSYKRGENDTSHIRLVVGKTRQKGDGNLDYPVIYLGLKRVYPIGELQEITKPTSTLTSDEIKMFNIWYKKVFFPQESIMPVQITAKRQKDTLAINSDNYDYFANSAGQDNIGQILGAILSFRRLKEQLGTNYKGGLLLIDEFESTLFPAAQTNLIDLFYNIAGKYNLQIVFTTHSLEALKHMIEKRWHNNGDTEVLYFTKVFGKLELIVAPQMQRIESDLKMETIPHSKIPKINLYCEDAEAAIFIKRLLGPKRTKYLNFCDATFGGDFLSELAKKNIPEFKNSIIILDGDKSPSKLAPNVLRLPGGASPENVFREFLQGLPLSHKFWKNDAYYTKQTFEKQLNDLTQGQYENRKKMKAWFKDQMRYWGRGAIRIFNCWKETHPEQAEEFCSDFVRVYNSIARQKSIPTIE
jgi:AAA15 family ATPase/GTPase